MKVTYSLKDFCVNFDSINKYKQGVYKLYHLKYPEKIYIGSASGTYKYGGFANRFNRHLRDLIDGVHCNARIKNVVNKYGLSGLRMEIIEICPPEKCIEREQYYIDLLNPYYNIARTAGNTLNVKPTLENIIKRSIPVLQYDLDGYFIKEHINSTFASEFSGVSSSIIRDCCNSKSKTSQRGSFQWKYKKNSSYPLKIEKYFYTQSHRVLCYFNNGTFFKEFKSILEASTILNIPAGNISKHLRDNSAICYNYIFRYYQNNYPLQINFGKRIHKNQIKVLAKNSLTNTIKEYDSFREASKDMHINRGTLSDRNKKGVLFFNYKHYSIEMKNLKSSS